MKTNLYSLKTALLSFSFLLLSVAGRGQVSITSLPYSKTDNFDAYNPTSSTTATSTLPAGWTYSGAANYKGRSTGTGNQGGFYGFGISPDYSIGALRSGNNEYTYTVSFTNNSGSTITSLTLGWNYEQWRYANTSGWNVTGTGQLASNSNLNGKDFNGVATGTDGIVSITIVSSLNLTGLSIANGQSFGITWVTTDLTSSDNGVSIDDFSMTAISGPTVITTARSGISTSAATLNGTINANSKTVTASFDYGTTTSYGSTITATPSSVTGTSDTSISAGLSSLPLNTEYHYRAIGTVSAVPTNGADKTFYTLAATPGVLVVDNPQLTTIDLTVNTTTQNSNPAITIYAIQETGGQYVQANGSLGATAVWQTAATWGRKTVTGLANTTTYTFRTKARNGDNVETAFGGTASGTTLTPPKVDYSKLQWPQSGDITEENIFTITARAYEPGVTDAAGNQAQITSWIGYSSTNNDPQSAGWTWIAAPFTGRADSDTNYEYAENINKVSNLAPGTYYYATRFQMGTGPFTYGGNNLDAANNQGGNWDGTNYKNGTLIINPDAVDGGAVSLNPTAVDEGTGSIASVEIYEPGVTNASGQGAGVTVEFAYSTANTNPNTWTWSVLGTYASDSGNNDVYAYTLPNNLTPGTYYVAARAKKAGSSFYQYFGTTFNVWNNNSAVLTVSSNKVDYANIQSPNQTLTRSVGDVIDVFSRVFEPGSTTQPGNGTADITGWIGYSMKNPTLRTDFDVATGTDKWTWIPMVANPNYTPSSPGYEPDNDEYWVQNFGQTAGNTFTNAAGTYYYVSRYQKQGSTEFVFGGNKFLGNNNEGGIWDGSVYNAGRLIIVEKQEIEITGNGVPILSGDTTPDLADHTDFGNVTIDYPLTRTYTIKNTGGANLVVSGIAVSGAADFSLTPLTFPLNIAGGSNATFNIVFNPTIVGAQNANISIAHNDDSGSENPYTFAVKGNGTKCDLKGEVIIASQDFEGTSPLTSGTKWNASLPTGPDASKQIYVGNTVTVSSFVYSAGYGSSKTVPEPFSIDTKSLIFANSSDDRSITMNAVNTTGFSNTVLTFKLGAFSTTNTNGIDASDQVKVEVKGGTSASYKTVMVLGGAGISSQNIWGYSATGLAAVSFNDTTSTTFIAPGLATTPGGSQLTPNGYSTIRVTDIPNVAGIQVRITFSNASGPEVYSIDNIKLISESQPSIKTWSASAWSPLGTPTLGDAVIIAGDYNTATNGKLDACTCEVNAGKKLTIAKDNPVTVKYEFINKNTDNKIPATNPQDYYVMLESDANLWQKKNIAAGDNTGAIAARREITNKADQYNYLISPLIGSNLKTNVYEDQTSHLLSSAPFTLYHNEGNNKFYNSIGTYIPGRGLAVKVLNGTGKTNAFFTGVPMNGTFTYNLVNSNTSDVNRGYNLIGNPYPSTLDLDAFYGANSTDLSPTFNFWDSTANTKTAQAGDMYGGQSYAQWNAVTPPGVGSGTKAIGDIEGTKKSTKFVKVGQAFMAKSLVATKTVTFNNDMRSLGVSEGFFGKDAREIAPFDRYWLNMTSPANITSEIAIVYFAGGNDAYTKDDSKSLGGSDAIYSIVDGQPISINGKNSFVNTDVQPLGSSHFAGGNYTIAVGEEKDGAFANGQNIYLKDKQKGILTNLSEGNYTFQANAGESTGRFEIIYLPETVLVTDNRNKDVLVVYRDGDQFVVQSPKSLAKVEVYDMTGKLITELKAQNKQAILEAATLIKGIYLLHIKTMDGEITNRKISKQ